MRISIRMIFAVTLLIALVFQTFARWRHLDVIRAEIMDYSKRVEHQGFAGRHAAVINQACRAVIADTELPTPAYRSAEENYLRQHPDEEFGRGK